MRVWVTVFAGVFADGRVLRGECGYSIRPRQCVRKLPGNTWAWCRDKCTLAFAYFSPSRSPYPPGGVWSSAQDSLRTCLPSLFFPSPPYYLPTILPSPPFFPLAHTSRRLYNRGSEYRTDVYATKSKNDDNIRGRMRRPECQSSFYDVSRRRLFIEVKKTAWFASEKWSLAKF